MLYLHFYLFEFLVLTLAAATSPFVLLNTSRDVDTVATRPVLETADPRLTIEVKFDGPKFPLISCLMSTVEFLAFLGSEDFSGSMEKVTWELGRYGEFGIVVAPSTVGGSIERRFVIWGLSLGVDYLIHENHFQAVDFTLLWEEEKVGQINLVAWPSTRFPSLSTQINSTQNLTPSNLSSIKPSSDVSDFPTNTSITAGNAQNPELTVRVTLTRSILRPLNVFRMIIAVLVEAAEMGADKLLRTYRSPAGLAGLYMVFEEPVPPRTEPPYFGVRWLMQTMAFLPEYMITKGVFQEAVSTVKLDGVLVANGFLGAENPRSGLANVNSNVSVS